MSIQKELDHRIAALETHVDILETELSYIDTILHQCGFPEGITTLKRTVEELLTESLPDLPEEDSDVL